MPMSVFCNNFALAGVWAFGRFADIKMDTKSIKTQFTIIENVVNLNLPGDRAMLSAAVFAVASRD